jgi:hypothetical protein
MRQEAMLLSLNGRRGRTFVVDGEGAVFFRDIGQGDLKEGPHLVHNSQNGPDRAKRRMPELSE